MTTVLYNSHDIVLLVVCYICFFFALATLCNGNKSESTHFYLGFFLLSQVAISANTLMIYGEIFNLWASQHIPAIFASLELALWLEGPLLLLYVRSALYQGLNLKKYDILLLLPIFIYFFTLILVNINFSTEQGSKFLLFLNSAHIQYYEHLRNIVRAAFGFWALWTIQGYQKSISQAYANPESVNYTWLQLLVIGFIILRIWSECYLIVFTFVSEFLPHSSLELIDFNILGIIENYGQLLLVTVLLFFALSDSRNILRVNRKVLESLNKKDKAVTFTAEQVERVEKHMKKMRPYLDNQLKIDDLAQQVSLPPKLLSSLINKQFNVNFFEYINTYRLNEVIGYLTNPEMDDQSIIELAFLAGYNSKSSFNRLFKLETGKTPSEFRKLR
jgi:AraC-like DNA-binding protein